VEEVQKKTLAILEEFLYNTNYKVLVLMESVSQHDYQHEYACVVHMRHTVKSLSIVLASFVFRDALFTLCSL
jgi:hypothetical protein